MEDEGDVRVGGDGGLGGEGGICRRAASAEWAMDGESEAWEADVERGGGREFVNHARNEGVIFFFFFGGGGWVCVFAGIELNCIAVGGWEWWMGCQGC